jgi:hypothetical protein
MSRLATQPARASVEFAIGGDLSVVRVGFGTMQLPEPGVWGEPRDHDEVIRVLRRAVELGVTLIDTVDSYGPEVSERLIHEALHPYPDDLVIATKAGLVRSGLDQWHRNGRPEHLIGLVLGGVLAQGPGWRWVFFINLPIGLLALLAAPRIVTESRVEGGSRSYDVPGAVTVTAALLLLVYAVTQVPTYGWGAGRTIGDLIGAAALLVVFLLIEWRFASNPLVPLRIFRSPTVAGADAVMALLGLSVFGVFFFVSLYLQQILHFSPLRAGMAYLPITAGIVVVTGVGTVLMGRIGARWLVATGMLFMAGGILLLTRMPVHSSYAADLLPAFTLVSLGAGLSFPAVTNAGVSGVAKADSGIASGLLNTFQRVGGRSDWACSRPLPPRGPTTPSTPSRRLDFPMPSSRAFIRRFSSGAG